MVNRSEIPADNMENKPEEINWEEVFEKERQVKIQLLEKLNGLIKSRKVRETFGELYDTPHHLETIKDCIKCGPDCVHFSSKNMKDLIGIGTAGPILWLRDDVLKNLISKEEIMKIKKLSSLGQGKRYEEQERRLKELKRKDQ